MKLINSIVKKLDEKMCYENFTQFVGDAKILWIECPFMELLGCKYHLRTTKEDKTGWYKDGKFFCEEM